MNRRQLECETAAPFRNWPSQNGQFWAFARTSAMRNSYQLGMDLNPGLFHQGSGRGP